jgi:hypothetical protein
LFEKPRVPYFKIGILAVAMFLVFKEDLRFTLNLKLPSWLIGRSALSSDQAGVTQFGMAQSIALPTKPSSTESTRTSNPQEAQIDAYIAANGTLSGTEAEKVRKIIEEKFVANYGVVMEPWTDWRRTGFPAISAPTNALFSTTPRSLYYPQVEIDLNNNAPSQKADLSERVFWDVQ